jgi:predicted nucleotide-binding protein
MLAMKKHEAIAKIQRAIDQIDALKKMQRIPLDFIKWQRDTEIALTRIFGEGSRNIKDFKGISYSLSFATDSTSERAWQSAYEGGLEKARMILQSMIEEIQEYWEDKTLEKDSAVIVSDPTPGTLVSKDIFVIHGHDSGAKEEVARYLTKLGLNPIILHEQANQGRTIIEKFESYALVPYAIAIFTPDDVGASVNNKDNLHPRARQNVLFEFGYFIGKLGRKFVCGLVKEGIEIPSDYSGVLYIPFDNSGSWKFHLVKELKAAGFDVDANLAL